MIRLDSARSVILRLMVLAALVLLPPMAIIFAGALGDFQQGMEPELDRKAATIGRDLAGDIAHAATLGIPLDRLVGMDEFFTPVLESNPELRYLALTNADGRILFVAGVQATVLAPHYETADFEQAGQRKAIIDAYLDIAVPLEVKGERLGHVHVGMDGGYVPARLHEILIDVVTVLAVAMIIALEVLLYVVALNAAGPLKQISRTFEAARRGDFIRMPAPGARDEVGRFIRTVNGAVCQVDELYRRLIAYAEEVKSAHFDKGVVERVAAIEDRIRYLFRFSESGSPEVVHHRRALDVRLPLFLFVLSEELSRSFMPLYGGTFSLPGVSPEMVAALPIAVFMAAIALASPFAGTLTERMGSRRVFLLGLMPAVLGYLLTGLAQAEAGLLVGRVATGIGYAIVTMACQSYVSKAAIGEQKAQGLGVYVGAVLTASVCGNAFGGILAEHAGYRAAFFASAVLAVAAGVLAARLVDPAETVKARREAGVGDLFRLLRNWRFAVFVVFAAMPAKLALTGVVFFLAPLYLHQLGWEVADIARILLLYAGSVVLLSPAVARLADASGWRAGLVALGGLIGGGGLLLPLLGGGTAPVLLALLCLGISHGLSASPQLALVSDLCWTEVQEIGRTGVLAQVRLLERVGSIAGPILAALLVPVTGYAGAIAALGAIAMAMAVVFAVAALAYGTGPTISSDAEVRP